MPGLGQSLIQMAQQFGGSSPQAAALVREVMTSLDSVRRTQGSRQEDILGDFRDIYRQTAGEQLRVMVKGFKDMVDELASFRREVKAVS